VIPSVFSLRPPTTKTCRGAWDCGQSFLDYAANSSVVESITTARKILVYCTGWRLLTEQLRMKAI